MNGRITVNGESRPLTAVTVAELLREEDIDLDARGVAVALNGAITRRPAWGETLLKPGDRIEIVKPFAGG